MEIVAGDIDLNEKDVIGEGGQGCVYKAFWKVEQKSVAVKKIGMLSNAAKREVMSNIHYILNKTDINVNVDYSHI